MKGELLRKRYFLIVINERSFQLNKMEADLRNSFNVKFRFINLPYVIFLTDQFQKSYVSEYISRHYPEVSIISVSGTMKKLKSMI